MIGVNFLLMFWIGVVAARVLYPVAVSIWDLWYDM